MGATLFAASQYRRLALLLLAVTGAACGPTVFRTAHFDATAPDDASTDAGATDRAQGDAGTPADADIDRDAASNDVGATGQWISGATSELTYRLYMPAAAAEGDPLPLVVMLHGCAQGANDLAGITRMNSVAEQGGFFVLYPEQQSSRESDRCWRWYDGTQQQRGSGEPADLVAVVDQVAASYSIDAARTYVAGMSAGAAMAVVLAATYPDRFAAIGTAAGLEYGATDAYGGIWRACLYGGPSPNTQGTLAFNAMQDQARSMRLIAFHGSADLTVYPIALDTLVAQWAQTNDLVDDGTDNDSMDAVADSDEAGTVPAGRSYTHRRFAGPGSGPILLESYLVDGMGHAWPGGAPDLAFSDDRGPDASALMWQFFAAGP